MENEVINNSQKDSNKYKKIKNIFKYLSLGVFIIASIVILIESAIPGDISADQSNDITDIVDDNINNNYDKDNIIDIKDIGVTFNNSAVSVDKENNVNVNDVLSYEIGFIPEDTSFKNIKIEASNTEIVKIDEVSKTITFNKEGKTNISFISTENQYDKEETDKDIKKVFTFVVNEIKLLSFDVSLSKNNIDKEDTLYLTNNEKIKLDVSYNPVDATYKELTYSDYDEKLISVDPINNEVKVNDLSKTLGDSYKENEVYKTKLTIKSQKYPSLSETINISISSLYQNEIRNLSLDNSLSNLEFYPSNSNNLLKINYSSYSSFTSFDINKVKINIKNDEENIISSYLVKENNLKENYFVIEFKINENKLKNNSSVLVDISYSNGSFNPRLENINVSLNPLVKLSSSLINTGSTHQNRRMDVYKLNNYDVFYNDLNIDIAYNDSISNKLYKYDISNVSYNLEDPNLFKVKSFNYDKLTLSINKAYLSDNLKDNYYVDVIYNENNDIYRFNIDFNYVNESLNNLDNIYKDLKFNYLERNTASKNILVDDYTYDNILTFNNDLSSYSTKDIDKFFNSYLFNNVNYTVVNNEELTKNGVSILYKNNKINGLKINDVFNNGINLYQNKKINLTLRNNYFDYLNISTFDIKLEIDIKPFYNLNYRVNLDNENIYDSLTGLSNLSINIEKAQSKKLDFVIYSSYLVNNKYEVYKEYNDSSLYKVETPANFASYLYFDINKNLLNGLNEGDTFLIFKSNIDNKSIKININVSYVPLILSFDNLKISLINDAANDIYNVDNTNINNENVYKVALNNDFRVDIDLVNKNEASSSLIDYRIADESIVSYISLSANEFKAVKLGKTSLTISSKIDPSINIVKEIEVVDSTSPFTLNIDELKPLASSFNKKESRYDLTLDYAKSYKFNFVHEYKNVTSTIYNYEYYEYKNSENKLDENTIKSDLLSIDSSNNMTFKDVGKVTLKITNGDKENSISTYDLIIDLTIKRDTRFTFQELAHLVRKGLGHFGLFLLTALSGSIFLFFAFEKYLYRYLSLIGYTVTGFLIALASEGIQALTPGRGPSFKDVMIDTVGFVVGVGIILVTFIIIHVVQIILNKKKNKNNDNND